MAQQYQQRPTAPPAFDEILDEIRNCHVKSVSCASQALAQDEANNNAEALALYLNALRHSENGLRYNIHEYDNSRSQWEEARAMQEQMLSTSINIKRRIYELQNYEQPSVPQHENPPAYSLHDPLASEPSESNARQSEALAEPLIVIENGVQMFVVSADSQVGTLPPSYPTTLQIMLLAEEYLTPGGPEAVLQVGDWVYPLAKDKMPVLKSANGAYIFPECTADGIQQGSAIGVVLSKDIPKQTVEMFESLLQNFSAFQLENPDEGFVDLTEFVGLFPEESENTGAQSVSDRMASCIANGAESVTQRVQQGTEYATNAVENRSENVRAKLTPATEKIRVNPYIKKGLEYTYNAANATVQLKDQLVTWLRDVTLSVGRQISPYFSKAVESTSDSASSSLYGALKVANAGLAGFGKIWSELEKAGSTIAKAVTTATVKNMEFKYGPDAAEATNLAMGAAINIGATAFILDNLGTKIVADIGANSCEPSVSYKSSEQSVSFKNSFKEDETQPNNEHRQI